MSGKSEEISPLSIKDHKQASPYKPPTLITRVVEFISLLAATLILLAVYITSALANFPDIGGVTNTTADVSNFYYTQITPSGWTFGIWGVIYFFQAVWIIYGWSFVFRPTTPRGISFVTYMFYIVVNICNITWNYLWGNVHGDACFGVIIVCVIAIYATLVAQSIHLYRQTPALMSTKKFRIDLYLTRIIVMNSITIYACWLTVATQLNFIIVLQYFSGVDGTTAATVGLSVLLVEIVVYFILENTILDRFTRFVFIVYPVFIWAFSGSLSAHWGVEEDTRNHIFTLVLLILCIVLFIVKIILWVVFAFKRPLAVPKSSTYNTV